MAIPTLTNLALSSDDHCSLISLSFHPVTPSVVALHRKCGRRSGGAVTVHSAVQLPLLYVYQINTLFLISHTSRIVGKHPQAVFACLLAGLNVILLPFIANEGLFLPQ